MELECFIHGAQCVSFSGRCLLSDYMTDGERKANSGNCSQPCRWSYKLVEETRPGQYYEIEENPRGTHILSTKDLCLVKHLKEMIEAGIDSFKVEGRMRSVYYIATVINVYRHLIDKIVNKTLDDAYTKYSLSVLNRCANRDSTEQFFNGLPGVNEQYFLSDRDEVSNKDFLGIVDSYDSETGIVTFEQRNYFKPGDVVEFFGPNLEPTTYTIPENIMDEDGNLIEVANHPKMIVKFKVPFKLCQYDMMRIKVFDISDFL